MKTINHLSRRFKLVQHAINTLQTQSAILAGKTGRLSRDVIALQDSEVSNVSIFLRLTAHISALESVLGELGELAHIPVEEFQSRISARKNHFLHDLLAQGEMIDPETAARLDDRRASEIPVEKGYPRVF